MKEDILEEIVDSWLLSFNGIFTKANVKFKPAVSSPKYNVPSDIDVLAVNYLNNDLDILFFNNLINEESPEDIADSFNFSNKVGKKPVIAASCKSWQSGFDVKLWHNMLTKTPNKVVGGKEAWKYFRELIDPTWSKAFCNSIFTETGKKELLYIIVVSKIKNPSSLSAFESEPIFHTTFGASGFTTSIKVLDIRFIIFDYLRRHTKTTLSSSQLGRLLQVISASGLKII